MASLPSDIRRERNRCFYNLVFRPFHIEVFGVAGKAIALAFFLANDAIIDFLPCLFAAFQQGGAGLIAALARLAVAPSPRIQSLVGRSARSQKLSSRRSVHPQYSAQGPGSSIKSVNSELAGNNLV